MTSVRCTRGHPVCTVCFLRDQSPQNRHNFHTYIYIYRGLVSNCVNECHRQKHCLRRRCIHAGTKYNRIYNPD